MDDSADLASTTEHKKPGPNLEPSFTRRAEGRAYVSHRSLSRSETAFCMYVSQGWPLWRCYVTATGSKCTKHAAEQQAWRWRLRPAVANEIIRLRASQSEATALHRVEKRNLLANIARDAEAPETARIQAIIVDNRMTGEDEPQRAAGAAAVVVFTVDPIGEGTRGLRMAEEQKTLAPAAEGVVQPESEVVVQAAPDVVQPVVQPHPERSADVVQTEPGV